MNKFLHLLTISSILIIGCENTRLTEYVIKEKDLVPEGISYSQKMKTFYLSSVAKSKIIKVDQKTGNQEDFISEKEFGYAPGAGIFVDDKNNTLHALGGYFRMNDSLSSLFTFDIKSQKLIKRYNVNDGEQHFLNDLIMDKKSDLFITDSKASAIYQLKSGGDSLELFYKSDEIQYPNGISISDDNTKLYIASHTKGIRILDIDTKTILNGIDTIGISQGIDGLEFYKGNLYAIQNGVETNTYNFRKLELNKTQDEIIGVKVIDSHNSNLGIPLTFCIVNSQAILIGNSNIQYLDQINFIFSKSDSISNTKLLSYELEN